jgi:hypothetical protein
MGRKAVQKLLARAEVSCEWGTIGKQTDLREGRQKCDGAKEALGTEREFPPGTMPERLNNVDDEKRTDYEHNKPLKYRYSSMKI